MATHIHHGWFLKRQNVAGQGGFDPNSSDGGDLNGGDGLHRKPGESDVGSGLELDRSLQRVAAQEAWLNEQSSRPTENWFTCTGAKEVSLGELGSEAPALASPINSKGLIVVDPRTDQWDQLSNDISDNDDLLVLDLNKSGIEQIKEIVDIKNST